MNRITTLNLTLTAFIVLLTWSSRAGAQTEEQIKQFNEAREEYFNENLELTDAEKKAFWPVYNDFHHRKMKLMEEERNTFRYSQQNAENLSDKEIGETLVMIRDHKEQMFKLEQEYYKEKFLSVLPPKKVLKLYKVEWDFRKHLVGRLRGQGKGHGEGHGGKGGGGGGGKGMNPMPPMDPPPLL